MKRFFFILIIFTALIITNFQVFSYNWHNQDPSFIYKLGQIAEKEVIAPFTFTVAKPAEMLRKEQDEAAAKVDPIFFVNSEITFEITRHLDSIFETVYAKKQDEKLKEKLPSLSEKQEKYLKNPQKITSLYEKLSQNLPNILEKGIIATEYADSFLFYDTYSTKKIAKNNFYDLSGALAEIEALFSAEQEKDLGRLITESILVPNITIDTLLTEEEKTKARETVSPILTEVLKNEEIISKNSKITKLDLSKLESLAKTHLQNKVNAGRFTMWTHFLVQFAFSCGLLFLLYYVLYLLHPDFFLRKTNFTLLLLLLIFAVANTFIVFTVFDGHPLIIFLCLPVLLVFSLFGIEIGIVYSFFLYIFSTQLLAWDAVTPLIQILSVLLTTLVLNKIKYQFELFPLLFLIVFSHLLFISIFAGLRFYSFDILLNNLLYGISSASISALVMLAVSPWLQHRLNLASKTVLLEFLDFNNPLLRKLSFNAPGTHQHSLSVATLAEAAAEAIGADPVLARVGSYYHDIGKIEDAKYFTENNAQSSMEHGKLKPEESAAIIRNHLSNGVALARKHSLPKPVIDIIQQHHGTSLIRYFYVKALEKEKDVDELKFRYFGPKPKSKEAVVVMLSDIVESTIKSIKTVNDVSENAIKQVLNESISRLINEKQLDESDITLKDLSIIKTVMLPLILSSYHSRIEYPNVPEK